MRFDDRPSPDEYGAFYAGYVSRVPAGDLTAILRTQIHETLDLLGTVSGERANYRYAPGKWTLKEVVGHMADTERVMSYRALRIARGDSTPLPGYEQDDYVASAGFGRRGLDDLAAELAALRQATVLLLAGLDEEAWLRRGTASGQPASVRALACIIAGHELHHRDVIEARYL
jgi:hypothetical protein